MAYRNRKSAYPRRRPGGRGMGPGILLRFGGGRKKTTAKRKGGYRSKRTSYGAKGGSWPTTTEASKQLAVYKNPMSMATQLPKIPDGSRNFSLGASFRAQAAPGGAALYIVCFPGVQTMGYAATAAADFPLTPAPTNMFLRPEPAAATGEVGAVDFKMPEMEAWRVVSQGMKIRCINSDLHNEGHYQAIRLRQCHHSKSTLAMNGYLPNWPNVPPTSVWPNDPSYTSGRVKDLIGKDFMLAPENPEHPFVEWPGGPINLGNEISYPVIIDTSYDVIIVKLSGTADSKYLVDMYQNIESTFRTNSMLNFYQTQSLQCKPATLAATQNQIKLKRRKAGT